MTENRVKGHQVYKMEYLLTSRVPAYYVVKDDDGEPLAVWLMLPTGTHARLPALKADDEPAWKLTIEDNGTLTVEPSIRQHRVESKDLQIEEWHGWLRKGYFEW